MQLPDAKAFVADLVRATKAAIDRAVAPLVGRLDDLEAHLRQLPAPERGAPGQDGKDGRDGADGKDGAPGDPGKDGRDGDPGRDGAPGKDGESGAAGRDGVDGQPGRDGDKGEQGEPGRDAEPGKPGEKGADGRDGKDGRDGRDGKDGAPGRDAAHIDPLPAIDEARAYPRGTWAKHAGGLWLARRETDGMEGWDCMIDGLARLALEQDPADPRAFTLRCVRSSGRVETETARFPVLIHQGIWSERAYEPEDAVTWGGSQWRCLKPTSERPGSSKHWQLIVKCGRDGKDGEKGERGEKGQDGRNGRGI